MHTESHDSYPQESAINSMGLITRYWGYLCPKFQPYRHADHEHVLECLLAGREERLKKYENARLGIQLDEVIAAVAQVAKLCKEGGHHV